MKLKSLEIGRTTTKNNVFVAPLAGFTDYAFRSICYSLGAGLCVSEMVSAKGLHYSPAQTAELLKTTDEESVKCVQLFGFDPKIMREACESKYLEKFDIVDINMGCPVPKVFNNGEGSALLLNLPLAEEIISECVKSGKTITVKTRLGAKTGDFVAKELAERAENAGASMIAVHGRYREAYYAGEIDYQAVREIKNAVKIPVIVNGGLFSVSDCDRAMEETGADGVMLARGALETPWLISQLLSRPLPDKKELIKRHIALLIDGYGNEYVATYMRKQMALYLKNARNAKALKVRAFAAKNADELYEIIDEAEIK